MKDSPEWTGVPTVHWGPAAVLQEHPPEVSAPESAALAMLAAVPAEPRPAMEQLPAPAAREGSPVAAVQM